MAMCINSVCFWFQSQEESPHNTTPMSRFGKPEIVLALRNMVKISTQATWKEDVHDSCTERRFSFRVSHLADDTPAS